MSRLILIFSFFIFQKLSFCQSNSFQQDSLLAIQYYTIANDSSHNVPLCYKYNELAKPLLIKTKQWKKYVYILLANNYCYKNLGGTEEWEENNKLAIEEAKRLLGTSHYYYSIAINNLGDFYRSNKEDYPKAKALFLSALNTFKDKTDGTSMLSKAGIYQNLGFVSKAAGDYKTALAFFDQAYDHFEKGFLLTKADITSNFRLALVNRNIAEILIQQKRYEEAIILLQESITKIKVFPKSEKYLVLLNSYLIKIYIKKHDIKQANIYLKEAYSFNNTSKDQQANLLELEAIILKESNNIKEAIKKIKKAISLILENKKIKKQELHYSLANLYAQQNNFPLAIQQYQKSFSFLLIDSPPLSETQNPKTNSKFRSKADAIKVLLAKGKTLNKWYTKSNQKEHLIIALEAFQNASLLTDQLRQNYQSEASKLFLNSSSADFYEEAIGLAKSLFELTEEEKYLETAFHFMEKSKAVLLLDEIRQKELIGKSLIPEDYLSRSNQFRIDLNFYQKNLDLEKRKENPDLEKIKKAETNIFKLKEAQFFFRDSLKNIYPNYYSLTENPIISIATIRKELINKQQSLIEYFVGKNKIFLIKISKEEVTLIEKEKTTTLKELINLLLDNRKLEAKNSLQIFSNSAFALFDYLVKPLNIASDQEVIIIPDGILGYLPFEILIKTKREGALPKDMDFLIENHMISYAYSATLLHLQNSSSPSNIKSLGVFPIFENSDRYLEQSKKEIEVLKNIGAVILKKKAANTVNFLDNLSSYDLIHLSTHAIAEDSLLQQPALYLRDSIFYLSDLYTLNLKTHLVVLSACETGIGQQRNGEGIMSLARGFTYAGVSSTLTTLWKVNDKANTEVITSFYRHLQQGERKDIALHLAKINYLNNSSDSKSAPYYWAGITLIGNNLPLQFEESTYSLYWGLVPILLLIIFMFSRKNKK